jgi:hypothetical protein
MDVKLSQEGYLITFSALTDIGREWLAENVPEYEAGFPVVADMRYAPDIVRGMERDGLEVDKL